MLLSEAIERLCVATRADGRSPRTVQSYREKLGHLLTFLSDVDVGSITIDDLRRWVVGMYERELSPFTVAGRIRHAKRLFNFLEIEGAIESNPARRIKTPRPKRKEPKGISWEDFLALLKTTEGGTPIDVRDQAVMMLLLDTGCRVGGLCGLTIDDLDLERRRALVREKGDKARFVFFQEETARALAVWLAMRPRDKGPWLFVSLHGKSDRLSARGISHMLKRRGARAGVVGPVNPHAFRHGFARLYLMNGGDLGTLSDILGHSDVSVTKLFYGVFLTDELQARHARFSPIARLGGGENGE
jgi:site-specific recombinase XerD